MPKPQSDLEIFVPQDIILDLLTDSEKRMLKQRLQIINLLQQRLSIRTIAAKIGVGTDTVMRMAKRLQSSAKLRQHFSQPIHQSTSKWVFGQVSAEE